jgi:hypothetical protein
MRELNCGCGCHLEGKDEQCLTIKVLLHPEATHPEVEEPTIELAGELVATLRGLQLEKVAQGEGSLRGVGVRER